MNGYEWNVLDNSSYNKNPCANPRSYGEPCKHIVFHPCFVWTIWPDTSIGSSRFFFEYRWWIGLHLFVYFLIVYILWKDFRSNMFYIRNMVPMITKNKIMGKRTRSQEIIGAPAPQIRFRIHVQKRMYMSFKIKIKYTLDTLQE